MPVTNPLPGDGSMLAALRARQAAGGGPITRTPRTGPGGLGGHSGGGGVTAPPPAPGPAPAPTTPGAPPATSPPGTQTTPIAGSLQGYTPPTPNAAVPIGAVNGIDPVNVTPTSLTGMQPFIDAAYNQSASRLDPQFAQAEDKFRQQMVGQGIPQGSEAYEKAWDDFSRSKNDAYATALNAAMGQGLHAQGQAWGQGAQQTQLAQAMRQWADQFGLNRDQLDLNAQNQFTQQSMDAYKLNQLSEQQKFMMAQALLGMVPNQAPAQIDTYSPYQIQQSGAIANANQQSQQSNGFWGALGSLGSAWLS